MPRGTSPLKIALFKGLITTFTAYHSLDPIDSNVSYEQLNSAPLRPDRIQPLASYAFGPNDASNEHASPQPPSAPKMLCMMGTFVAHAATPQIYRNGNHLTTKWQHCLPSRQGLVRRANLELSFEGDIFLQVEPSNSFQITVFGFDGETGRQTPLTLTGYQSRLVKAWAGEWWRVFDDDEERANEEKQAAADREHIRRLFADNVRDCLGPRLALSRSTDVVNFRSHERLRRIKSRSNTSQAEKRAAPSPTRSHTTSSRCVSICCSKTCSTGLTLLMSRSSSVMCRVQHFDFGYRQKAGMAKACLSSHLSVTYANA